MPLYAHTDPTHPANPEFWEPLFTNCPQGCQCQKCGHLDKVANLTAQFCAELLPNQAGQAAASWGRAAGLWHDLGKFSQEFQNYLRTASEHTDPHQAENETTATVKVDHSSAGAQHAATIKPIGTLLAYIIAGHLAHHRAIIQERYL